MRALGRPSLAKRYLDKDGAAAALAYIVRLQGKLFFTDTGG